MLNSWPRTATSSLISSHSPEDYPILGSQSPRLVEPERAELRNRTSDGLVTLGASSGKVFNFHLGFRLSVTGLESERRPLGLPPSLSALRPSPPRDFDTETALYEQFRSKRTRSDWLYPAYLLDRCGVPGYSPSRPPSTYGTSWRLIRRRIHAPVLV